MSDTQSIHSYSSEEKIRYQPFKPKTTATGGKNWLHKIKRQKPSHVPTNPPELQSLETLIKETTQFSYFDKTTNAFDADQYEEESSALDGLRNSIAEKNRQHIKRWQETGSASTTSSIKGSSRKSLSFTSPTTASLQRAKTPTHLYQSSLNQSTSSKGSLKSNQNLQKQLNTQFQKGKRYQKKKNNNSSDEIQFGEPIIPLNLAANGTEMIESLDDPEYLDELKEKIGEYIIKLNRNLQDLFPTQIEDDLEEYEQLIKELSGEQDDSEEDSLFSQNVWQKKEAPSMILYRSLSKVDELANGYKI